RYENALIDLLKRKQAGEKIEPAREMLRRRSILATCFGLMAGRLKRKRLFGPRHALIRCSRRLGTIFPICWMSRVGPKLQSIVCAGRCTPPRNMSTRCSILRFYYSEAIGTTKRRGIGGGI